MIKRIWLGAVFLVIAILASLFIWRALAQYRIEAARHIDTQTGIALSERVQLGGISQAITIRGADRNAPILLVLHGGPGAAQIGFSHLFQTEWEKEFIVVEWDQRGAGKTRIPKSGYDTLTIDLIYSDTEELVQHLRKRFGRDKIFLLGHSWGSVLGIRLAHEHPDWLHAYIGAGQLIDMQASETASYAFALQGAREAGDKKAMRILADIGPPPYPQGRVMESILAERKILMSLGGSIKGNSISPLLKALITSPDYAIGDVLRYNIAMERSMAAMIDELMAVDIRQMGDTFDLPLFFILGRKDRVVSSDLMAAYAEKLSAPHVEIIWFEESAHFPMLSEPEKFASVLREKIKPVQHQKQD